MQLLAKTVTLNGKKDGKKLKIILNEVWKRE